jgi:ABC-type antimicrobial peptide transport system permease subunit
VGEELRELGVRLALGARPWWLVAYVMGRSLALAGAGLALGLVLALAAGRAVSSSLYGVAPHDPATLAAAGLLLLAAAAAAAFAPARRAARLDPATVLRGE